MNDLSTILSPETVFSAVSVGSRKSLFQQLGKLAHEQWGLDARTVERLLVERERLVSTGCGAGIALPHARIEGLRTIHGAFLRLEEPVDFDSVDDLPVDLVFMLISPAQAGAAHLKALARVSRMLRDRSFAEKLRGAGSDDALYALLSDSEARDAA
ncbi:PTS sugar transporter subunit IIA [Stakelama saccharophila]|uniref:PTS sugar transporter subunit IIA n=1 Tax=Stakelama saccharophila TaxID=3075605 RepID=A0ABZ0B9Q4_9SPHN|nr:PTS sugar transporter subunit IIA [Stakelama sp. W311]WNO53997.1 PTS sugar transporter subunit IIA [Stakelama sp. W311]